MKSLYKRGRSGWTKHLDFMLLDLFTLNLAFVIGYIIRFPRTPLPYFSTDYRQIILILSIFEVSVSVMQDNLSDVLRRSWFTEIKQVFWLILCVAALTSLYMFLMHNADIYSRLVFGYFFLCFFILDICLRLILKKIIISLNVRSENKSLLLVTSTENVDKIAKMLCKGKGTDLNIVGLVLCDDFCPSGEENRLIHGIPVVSDLEHAPQFICRMWIDEIMIYLPESHKGINDFLSVCAEMGVTVHNVLQLQNVDRHKQFIETIGGYTVITTAFNYIRPYQQFIKRFADIIGGLVGSLFAILLGIFVAPAIYICSPGPILFRQERIGQNGKRFIMYKFRSMYPGSENQQEYLSSDNLIKDGYMFKLKFDPRVIGNKILPDGTHITGIGEFIRKTSIDEFPQFFNVLKGDMSLVGTRPPTVDEWNSYQYHHRARLAAKPGITGLWQISGRSEITDFEEVVKLDTKYICNWRLSEDIKILFKTIKVLILGRGAL